MHGIESGDDWDGAPCCDGPDNNRNGDFEGLDHEGVLARTWIQKSAFYILLKMTSIGGKKDFWQRCSSENVV